MNEELNKTVNDINMVQEQLQNDTISGQIDSIQDTIFEDAQQEISDMTGESDTDKDAETKKEAAEASLGGFDYGEQKAKDYMEWSIKHGFEGHFDQAKWNYENALKRQEEENIKKALEENT